MDKETRDKFEIVENRLSVVESFGERIATLEGQNKARRYFEGAKFNTIKFVLTIIVAAGVLFCSFYAVFMKDDKRQHRPVRVERNR